ncbi:acyl-CoA dehydrogenase family protein [Pseudonocardia alaniniphila]|uniref:Acyl-CoA dehydrogenase family protein n=1 Tax=Pseudonocardia alaniniphila TaxID=75291 RepID=A0ABS9TTZ4_9PSEU|nr:acyl-CoA dehydrogenase family protein [Pseudonocardia alaniniphila]MCH6171868.1 acyl-CoA dehydrogenase family protein [Pseudonocardia alaniniphila]
MTTTDVRPTDVETLMAAARSAVPVLAANAGRAERDRRLPAESTAALRDAGAFALATPTRFGGLDADLPTTVRVISELGRGCPSSAWLVAVSAEAQPAFAPLMSEEVLAEFYADPDTRLCGAGNPPGRGRRVAGGVRVSGRWPYASGCEDAPWAITLAMVGDGEGPPEFAFLLTPTSDLDIARTWDTAGMRGTGSHTLVADDVFVPQARVLPLPTGPNGAPDPFAGRPARPLGGGVTLLAALVGAARGALDVAGSTLHERKPPMTQYDNLAASPGARHWFAEATHLIESAQHDLLVLAAEIDRLMAGPTLADRDTTTLRMRLNSLVQRCQEGVNLLLDLNGASSFAADNPLQRFWRDLHVGSRHVQFNPYLALENHAGLLATARPTQEAR